MILLVGLGNPGPRYADTRHNIGAAIVEEWARSQGNLGWREKFSARYCLMGEGEKRVVALLPQTYMNRSGQSVRAAADFYKISPQSVVVVHDELDLPAYKLRLKRGGGEAGNNGLRSISSHLGSPSLHAFTGRNRTTPR